MMTNSNNNEDLRQQARNTVVNRNVYKGVMSIWLIFCAGLVTIWYLTTPSGYFWPVWPISTLVTAGVIWGLAVYGLSPFRVREHQVEREFQRLQQRTG